MGLRSIVRRAKSAVKRVASSNITKLAARATAAYYTGGQSEMLLAARNAMRGGGLASDELADLVPSGIQFGPAAETLLAGVRENVEPLRVAASRVRGSVSQYVQPAYEEPVDEDLVDEDLEEEEPDYEEED